jgi:hypothetical protein
MSRHPGLYPWATTVARRFPRLSKAQAWVLALWSFGMVLAHACGLSSVALALAPLLGRRDNTVRQRLREWYQEASAKRGRQRTEVDPATCFAPLLRWVLDGWPSRRLALALDATTLGDWLTVLAVSVVYRGCGVPVAWKVLAGNQPEAWQPHWEHLLAQVRQAVGPDWTVLVLSDRGLESQQLFRAITALGWHPLMRVKAVGHFRPQGWRKFYPLAWFAPEAGRRWCGGGHLYKKAAARLEVTLLARWDPGQTDRWLLVSDLPPAAANPAWYAWRSWIEQGFKVLKRAGWQWQRARMRDPQRCDRLWVAVAVATLWLLEVGGVAEEEAVRETLPPVREAKPQRPRVRQHRVFRRGLAVIVAALVSWQALPPGRFLPDAWPEVQHEPPFLTEEMMNQTHTYP